MLALGGGAPGIALADDRPPSGMVGMPSENISSDLPPNTPMGEAAEELEDHGVYSSAHADTLEVIVTNPGRASETYSGGHISGSGPVAIVFRDDVNSEGREVAISRDVLVDVMGFEPQLAKGAHESGEEWATQIRYEGDYAIVEVPGFSENTVTFAGTFTIDADPADDGFSHSYQVGDADAVDDLSITINGSEATSDETSVWPGTADGDSVSFDVEGTQEVDMTVTFEGESDGAIWEYGSSIDDVAVSPGGSTVFTVDGNEITALDSEDGSVKWNISHASEPYTVGADDQFVYVGMEDGSVRAFDRSDQSEEWSNTDHDYDDILIEVKGDTVYSVSNEIGASGDLKALSTSDGSEEWATSFSQRAHGIAVGDNNVFVGGDNDVIRGYDKSSGNTEWDYSDEFSNRVPGVEYHDGAVWAGDIDGNLVKLDPDDGDSIETTTVNEDDAGVRGIVYHNGELLILTAHSDEIHYLDPDALSEIRVDEDVARYEEGATHESDLYLGSTGPVAKYNPFATESPSVTIDGETVSYSGELDGAHSETISVSTDTYSESVSLNDGFVDLSLEWTETTESVDPAVEINGESDQYSGTLAVGETWTPDLDESALEDGANTLNISVSEAYDGPPGEVVLEYSHLAETDTTVQYSGETWNERYESVSHEWVEDLEDATLTIPFSSDRVIAIDGIEVNESGSWEKVSEYDLDGTELTVELGDVDAGEVSEIRANGSKVDVIEGEIEVIDPTTEGDVLATEIEVIDSTNVSIDVSGTTWGDRLHYLESSSWVNDERSRFTLNAHYIEMPEASDGGTATIATAPIAVNQIEGDSAIEVVDADEPRFTVYEGDSPGGELEVGYTDTVSGQWYGLYTIDGNLADREQASSPAWFTISSDEETYYIDETDPPSSIGAGSPIGPGDEPSGIPSSVWALGIVLLGLLGVGLVARAIGGRDERRRSRERSLDLRGRSISMPSLPSAGTDVSSTIAIGGVAIVGVIGVLIVAPWVFPAIFGALTIPTAAIQQFGTILLGIGLLVGLWQLDQRTEQEIPRWLMGIAAGLAIVWILETLQPGVLLGAVSSGFETIAPLFFLALLAGAIYFVRGWREGRTTPDTEVRLDLGGDNDS